MDFILQLAASASTGGFFEDIEWRSAPSDPNPVVMADVDTWSSKLRPDDVFQQFTEVFTTFSSSWIPQLELTPELLETNYGAVRRFAPCLELANESFLGKETITNAVSPLGDLISRLNNDTRDVLKLLVTDVLFCGSLIPVFLSPAPSTHPQSLRFDFLTD